MVDKAFQQITMPLAAGKTVAFSLFDEGSHILKKATFNKSLDQLRAQSAIAQFMLDRYDEFVDMGKMGEGTANISFLKERFTKEKHRGIRAEIARQLVVLAGADDALIRSLLQDGETDVRRITIENLNRMAMPVVVEYTTKGGKIERKNLPVEIWQNTASWKFKVNTTEEISRVVVDPDKTFPDYDSANNTWKKE
jgi:hypothetical protein